MSLIAVKRLHPMAGGLSAICLLISAMAQMSTGQQVYLTLGNEYYYYVPRITANNSEILITDIGNDNDYGVLICRTDLTTCCRNHADNDGNGALGQWTFPNGSVILNSRGSEETGQQFYIRRNLRQSISLNRILTNNPLSPTGSYCCTVPTTGGDMTLCANLVLCPSLSLDNGTVAYNDTTLGENAVATHTCDTGYALNPTGNSTRLSRTCEISYNGNGVWSGSAHICVVLCSLLPPLSNGMISYSNQILRNGSVATHSCNHGYVLLGDAIRTCEDGQWSSVPPHCADQAIVQLKFGPTKYCLDWNSDRVRNTRVAMFKAIQTAVLVGGNHTFPLEHISKGVFSCSTSKNQTTYRTTLTGTRSIDADKAAFYIQKWVESGEAIQVEWYLVYFDPDCPTFLSSMSMAECPGN